MKRSFIKSLGILGLLVAINKTGFAATSTATPAVLPTAIVTSSITASGGLGEVQITTAPTQGPFSTGQYLYVTHIRIEMYATGTLTGGATPVVCTTKGLNGVQYQIPTAAATGTTTAIDQEFTNALQASQSTSVFVTCPRTASVIWNIQVASYSSN